MTQGRPIAAPAHFPYDHPSMAVVLADEARADWLVARQAKRHDRTRYERERRSARG